MDYSILEVFNLTFSAIVIVLIVLTVIMISINIVGKIVGKFEANKSIEIDTLNVVPQTEDKKEKTFKEIFEEDSYAKVAALVALAQASNDEQDKRFKITSIVKK